MGMAFDSKGNMYATVAHVGLLRISKISGAIRIVWRSKHIPLVCHKVHLLHCNQLPQPSSPCNALQGISIDSNDNVFFTDATDDSALMITPTSSVLSAIRNELISGYRGGKLLAYDSTSNKTLTIATNLAFPSGIDAGDGCLYFCEAAAARISAICADQTKSGVLFDRLPMLPYALRASRFGYVPSASVPAGCTDRYFDARRYWVGGITNRNKRQTKVLQWPLLRRAMLNVPLLFPESTKLPPVGSLVHISLHNGMRAQHHCVALPTQP
jgi:hypothetical protein